MTALIIIGAIVLFFGFLLSLKGTLTVEYTDELALSVRVLFVKIGILPKKQDKKGRHSMSRRQAERLEKRLAKKKEKADAKKQRKKEQKEAEKKENKKSKSSLRGILDTIDLVSKVAKAALGALFGDLSVDVKKFKITVATDDAATTAIAYGAVSQSVSYLLAVLKNNKRVKGLGKAELDVRCDFLADTPTADIKIAFSLRVWHILHIGLSSLVTLIKHKLNSMKKNENN